MAYNLQDGVTQGMIDRYYEQQERKETAFCDGCGEYYEQVNVCDCGRTRCDFCKKLERWIGDVCDGCTAKVLEAA